jgi:hypothetical protein
MITHVALVSEVNEIPLNQVVRVSAALQKQVLRDVGQYWEVRATVDAFAQLEDVPLDYWPIIVIRDVRGAAGIHLDRNGRPFAVVEAGPSWSLTASHECLEMLVDPFGNRLTAGPSPNPAQGRVEFLVEVCDPSEDEQFAYTVNNVVVSDFYTQHYFDPVQAAGVLYSFTGAITQPRQVLSGGYLSWHDPLTDHWFQETFFGGNQPVFNDLGVLAQDGQSIRSIIDHLTPDSQRLSQVQQGARVMRSVAAAAGQTDQATTKRAQALRERIEELKNRG